MVGLSISTGEECVARERELWLLIRNGSFTIGERWKLADRQHKCE